MASAITPAGGGYQAMYQKRIATITKGCRALAKLILDSRYQEATPVCEALLKNLHRFYRLCRGSSFSSEHLVQLDSDPTFLTLARQLRDVSSSNEEERIRLVKRLIVSVKEMQVLVSGKQIDEVPERTAKEFVQLLQQARNDFSPREGDALSQAFTALGELPYSEEAGYRPYLEAIQQEGVPIEYVRRYSISFIASQETIYCWAFAFYLKAPFILKGMMREGKIVLLASKEVVEIIVDHIHLSPVHWEKYSTEQLTEAFYYARKWELVSLQEELERELLGKYKEEDLYAILQVGNKLNDRRIRKLLAGKLAFIVPSGDGELFVEKKHDLS